MNILNNLTPIVKNFKRVGRGQGSGLGKTCGRGYNGAKSRPGYSNKFKMSQTGYMTKFPKRGFNARKRHELLLKISDILAISERYNLDVISLKTLQDAGFISSKKNYFISLVSGLDNVLDKKIKLIINKISKTAKEAVESASGCSFQIVEHSWFAPESASLIEVCNDKA